MKLLALLIFLFPVILSVSLRAQPAQYHLKVKKGRLKAMLNKQQNNGPIISAHRGGRYYHSFPENALESFDHILRKTPAMIECDVEMTKDSVLILMHDQSLDRTTTGTGKVREADWAYVQGLALIDDFGDTSTFKVPTLQTALQWTKKKALLELDVKRGVPFERVVHAVKKANVEDYVIIITYNIDDAKKVYRLNNDLVISVSIRNNEELASIKQAGIPYENLIAFTGTRLTDSLLYQQIHDLGILTILGTMGNIDNKAKARQKNVYRECIEKGIDVLATDRPIEAAHDIDVIPVDSRKHRNYIIRKKKAAQH